MIESVLYDLDTHYDWERRLSQTFNSSWNLTVADLHEGLSSNPPSLKNRGVSKISQFPLSYPNGGFKAWSQVVAGFLFMFNAWGIALSFGVFQTFYTSSTPSLANASEISLIGTIQSSLLLFIGMLTGPLFDAGHISLLARAGSALIVLGLLCASLASTSYPLLLTSQGVLTGLGMGFIFLPSISVPATYFSTHRTLATGLAMAGSSVGGFVYPLAIYYLLPAIGHVWTMRALALIAFTTLAVACVLLTPRQDMFPLLRRRRKLTNLIALNAFRDLAFAALAVGTFLAFLGVAIPYFYIQILASTSSVPLHGLPSAWLISFLSLGGLFGRLIPHFLAETVGPLNLHAVSTIMAGVLVFLWPMANSLAWLVAFALAFGFFSGAVMTLPTSSVARVTDDLGQLGGRLGGMFVVNGLALLGGAPVGGLVLETVRKRSMDDAWAFFVLSVSCGAVMVVGGLGIALARIKRSGWRLGARV